MQTTRRHRLRRGALWTLAVLAGLLVVGRLVLNPLVESHTRKVLASLEGYRGSLSGVSVSVLALKYEVDELKLVKVPTPSGGEIKRPYFFAKKVSIQLDGRELLHRRALVAKIILDEPKLNLIAGKTESKSQAKIEDPHLGQKLKRLSPLDVQRLEVRRAEISYADETGEGSPTLWFHKLDGTLENLATRRSLQQGEPTTLAVSATLQKTGQVSVFLTADPLAKALAFSGRAAVEGLAMTDLGEFLVRKADLKPEKGTVDVYAQFDVHDGELTGGVKPLLKDVDLSAAKGGLGPALKSLIANAGLGLLSDRVPGRNAAATVVPIHGNIRAPKTELWPTVWTVLRNSFIAGLQSGFSDMPKGAQPDGAAQARAPQSGGSHR